MSKIKAFLNKPFTWGTYLKLCAGCYAAALAIIAAGWWTYLRREITWGKRPKEEEEVEEPTFSWTDED